MESLIGLVNRIQRACTVLGDHGGEGTSLWEALPSVAVVGGQVKINALAIVIIYDGFVLAQFFDVGLLYHLIMLMGFVFFFGVFGKMIRVLGNLPCSKALLGEISCLVDQVILLRF